MKEQVITLRQSRQATMRPVFTIEPYIPGARLPVIEEADEGDTSEDTVRPG